MKKILVIDDETITIQIIRFTLEENANLEVITAADGSKAIEYLENIGERVNIINIAEIVGCHPSIHKGFNKIYKSLKF